MWLSVAKGAVARGVGEMAAVRRERAMGARGEARPGPARPGRLWRLVSRPTPLAPWAGPSSSPGAFIMILIIIIIIMNVLGPGTAGRPSVLCRPQYGGPALVGPPLALCSNNIS